MGERRKRHRPARKTGRPLPWVVIPVLVMAAILLITGYPPFRGAGKEKDMSFRIVERETKPLLSPSMFSGVIRAAYEAAAENRDVFNEVFCYCSCSEPPSNHKTLLSCFTDRHGAD